MTNKDLHYLLKLILLYFFFQVTPIASGQDKKWWTDFNNPKLSDTTRLRTIHNTASDLSATNPDSALLLANYEFEFAKKVKNNIYAGRAKILFCNIYIGTDNNSKAIENGNEALKYLEQTNEKKTDLTNLKPSALKSGDTIAITSPAGAVWDDAQIEKFVSI